MALKRSFTLHSGIMEALGNAGRFYYYLRYLDVKGSGYAEVELYQAMEDINIARSTFYKYLKNEVFIRKVDQIGVGRFRVHYHGVARLTTNFIIDEVIDDLGVALDIYLEELTGWRELITLGQAITLQEQSIHAIKKAQKESGRGYLPLIDIPEVFEGKQKILSWKRPKKNEYKKYKYVNVSCLPAYMHILDSSLILKKVFDKERVFLYIDSNKYSLIGGSQETIAEKMGRSVRTIQRRLKNVDKVQQCFTHPQLTEEYQMEEFIQDEDWTTYSKKFFAVALVRNPNLPDHSKHELFQSYTNLYNPNQVAIKGCRYLRLKVKSRLIWIRTNLPEGIELSGELDTKICQYEEKQMEWKAKGQESIPFVPKSEYSSSVIDSYKNFLDGRTANSF